MLDIQVIDDPVAATVAYAPGQVGYGCELPGPFGFATYTAVVESYNATGTGGGTAAFTAAVGLPASPSPGLSRRCSPPLIGRR